MRRWLLSLILIPFSLVILLLAILLVLLSTDSGLRFIAKQSNFWQKEVYIERTEGNVWQGFSLFNISYQNPQTQVKIDKLIWTWDSQKVWQKIIHIELFALENIKIKQTGVAAAVVPKAPESDPFTELADIHLPVAIWIDKIHINNIQIEAADGSLQIIDDIILQAKIDKKVELKQFSVSASQFKVSSAGQFDLYQPHALDLVIDWQANLPENPDLPTAAQGQAQIKGDLNQLKIGHQAQAPLGFNIDVNISDPLKQVKWQAQIDWQQLRWPLNPQQDLIIASPTGQLQLEGDLKAWQLTGKTTVEGGQIPKIELQLAINGDQSQANIKKLTAQLLQGQLDLSGHINWKSALLADINLQIAGLNIKPYWADWSDDLAIDSQLGLHFSNNQLLIKDLALNLPPSPAQLLGSIAVDLSNSDPDIKADLTWNTIQWPLTGQALATIDTGVLSFSGNPNAYKIDLKTDVDGETIPATSIHLTAQGNAEQLKSFHLKNQLLAGQVNLSGEVAWSPAVRALVDMDSQDLNLTAVWADWPASLRLAQSLQLAFIDNQLAIRDLSLSLPPESTKIQGQANIDLNQTPPQIQLDLNWADVQWPLLSSDSPALAEIPSGDLVFSGTADDYKIHLNSQINAADINDIQLKLDAQGNAKQLTDIDLVANLLAGQVQITGQSQWQPTLSAALQVSTKGLKITQFVPELSEEQINSGFKLNFENQLLTINDINLKVSPHALALTGNAEVQLPVDSSAAPTIALALNWQALQWPLNVNAAEAQIQSPTGQINVTGRTDAYTVELETEILGKDVPKSQWQALISGDSQQAKIIKLDSQLLAGRLHSQGSVQWQPHLTWDIQLEGQDINPAQQWADWAGKLAWKIDSQGEQKQKGALIAKLNIAQFRGKLRDYPLKLTGKLVANEKGYAVNGLRFNSGDTQLAADLSMNIKEEIKGNWKIDIADLSQVLPDGQGKITGKGSIAGTLTKPAAKLALQAANISLQNNQLATLNLTANIDKDQQFKVNITADNLQQGDQVLLNSLGVNLSGNLTQHRLNVTIDNPVAQVALALKGGLNKQQQWQGLIQTLDLTTVEFDKWQLTETAALQANAEQAALKNFCWQAQKTQAQFCLKTQWNASKGSQLAVDVKHLPFSLLKSVLPKTTDIDGAITGKITARIATNGRLYNQTDLQLTQGEVRSWFAGEQHAFPFTGGDITVNIDDNGMTATTDLKFLSRSLIKGHMRLPQFKQLNFAQDQSLEADLNIELADLSILPSLVPQLEKTEGKLSIDLELDGALNQPNIEGQVSLRAKTDLPDLGLELRDLHTYINAEGNKMHISGGVQSGEGSATWEGVVKLTDLANWNANLTIKGERLTVMDTDGIQALLSPDIKITANPTAIDIQGQLAIPEALISPNIAAMGGLGDNAVAVSEDVVMVSEDDKNTVTDKKVLKSPIKVTASVLMLLNEAIILDVADFKSSIDGALLVTLQENGELTGNGAVQIINGTYRAYGQDLKIKQGFIIFPDVPITDPVLNIKAIRKIYNDTNEPPVETAGLHITGTGQLPVVSLFSDPMSEEADILSYIITGTSLSGGDVKRSSLSLGTYVAPHIYVSFALDLFDQSKEFTVRYDMSKKWGIDTTIGDRDSGVDLTYRIGR